MRWLRTWQIGVKSLALHPLRSFLTVLSVIFGVFSVIFLLAVANGIGIEAQKKLQGLGANNIIVRSRKPLKVQSSNSTAFILSYGLKREDFEKLEVIPTISSALKIRETKYEFRYGDRRIKQGRLVGCEREYAEVTKLEVDHSFMGSRFIEDSDDLTFQNNCAIAAEVAKRLFPYENPIGKTVYLEDNQEFFKVVGVMKKRGATSAIGGSLAAQDFSNDVYIPLRSFRKLIGDRRIQRGTGSREGEEVELSQITLRIDHIDNVVRTAKLIKDTLMPESEKGIPTSHAYMEDIAITVPKELLDHAERQKRIWFMLMVVIAGISLLVGGIGIMNIMLATVTERTREIGIRRALGARRIDITRQFMVETIALTVVGGAMGVGLGIAASEGIVGLRKLLGKWQVTAKWIADLPEVIQTTEPVIVMESIPLAFATAVLTGLMFGIYPATRAAKMDPIEALRHE